MSRILSALTLLVLTVGSPLIAQTCDIPGLTAFNSSCPSALRAGESGTCSISVMNRGAAPCPGDWYAAIGVAEAGTADNPQPSSNLLASCTQMGPFTLPIPLGDITQLKSAMVCQGNGSLAAGQTLALNVRITPAASAPSSEPYIVAAYMRFQRTGSGLGTTFAQAILTHFINLENCTTIVSAPGAVPSGLPYPIFWSATSNSAGYEIQEATRPDFSDAISINTGPVIGSPSRQFQHTVSAATTYYYRVRPLACGDNSFGPSTPVVVLPQQPATSREFDILVPEGTTATVTQQIRFDGQPAGALFTATTDKPYLTVTPASGSVASDGSVTLTLQGDPKDLPLGANTGTVILTVTTPGLTLGPVTNADTTVSTPVSISLVTPVSPTAKTPPPTDALIVPAVAHLEGAGARFQSDVRITNAGTATASYELSFTPSNSDGTTIGRKTTVRVPPDQTIALNDVLRAFFGFALPTDSAGGVLEIRNSGGSTSSTYASSRTYATSGNGTYGQFVPALPIARFLKQAGGALTLTQVSQGDAFRTNIGLVEALGLATAGRLRIFNAIGQNLSEVPFSLLPFEFKQLNSFLAANGIFVPDARVEMIVDSGSGAVTTYASVLDNKTQDPLLVSALLGSAISATRYVLPGVADFVSPVSNFHTDVRIYNASSATVVATATFYPQGNPAASTPRTITIAPGEIKAYDNILPTLFGVTGTGGSIVVATTANSSLIVSARTYSNDPSKGGTFGQFIPAVTPAEGIGLGDPPIQILQLEQSKNFRTNVGLTELTGNPVTVQVSLILPDSKVTPSTNVDLQANEFRQLNSVIASLAEGNVYNARVTVKVVGGTGRVTAYGSVIDNLTSDPTYIPAQK